MRVSLFVSLYGLILIVMACPETSPGDDDDAGDDDDSALEGCMETTSAMMQTVCVCDSVTVDWTTLTEDENGQPLDPETDIHAARLTYFDMDEDEFVRDICEGGEPNQDDLEWYQERYDFTGTASSGFDASSFEGRMVVADVSGVWEVRGTAFARVDAASSNDTIFIGD